MRVKLSLEIERDDFFEPLESMEILDRCDLIMDSIENGFARGELLLTDVVVIEFMEDE